MRTSYAAIRSYITTDGSEIRELMHPDHHGNQRQSLAVLGFEFGIGVHEPGMVFARLQCAYS